MTFQQVLKRLQALHMYDERDSALIQPLIRDIEVHLQRWDDLLWKSARGTENDIARIEEERRDDHAL